MTEEKQKGKARTDIYSGRTPAWIETVVPPEYENQELFEIILFFVFHSPCEGQSHLSKPLTCYGWKKMPWYSPAYLKDKLDDIIFGNGNRYFYTAGRKPDFKATIDGKDFEENFYNHRSYQRIAMVKINRKGCQSEYMSLFYHIRNSLAHGRLAMYPAANNDVMFVMEDGGDVTLGEEELFEVTARIVILKSSLCRIIQLITRGPAGENNYSDDMLCVIEDGKNTKKKIMDALMISEKEFNKTKDQLVQLGKIKFDRFHKVWHIVKE